METLRAIARGSDRALPWALAPRRVLQPALLIEALPLAAAVFSIVGFLIAAYFRLTFDYPLSVMETPTMEAMRRILNGQPLYAEPTLDYVAPVYAPLLFYLSALVSHVVGVNLLAPRLVSLAASLASATLVGYLVWSETRNTPVSVIAVGLFISTTTLSSLSLDLARVDALALCLLLAAITTARMAQRQPTRALWLNLASGALTGLAVLSKQTAVVLAVPLLLVIVLDRQPRSALAYLLGLLAVTGGGMLLLYAQFGRWAEFFLFTLARQHMLTFDHLGLFWTDKLLPAATLLLVLAPVFLIGRALRGDDRLVRFWLLVGLSMLALGWVATLNYGSDDNVLLPALAVLVILGMAGFDEALRRIGSLTHQARAFRTYAFALLAVEFLIVGYNPRQSAPLRSDVWGADRFVSTVADTHGSVFGPDFAELARQAGKGEQAFGVSTAELLGAFGGSARPEGGAWIAEYRAALDQRQFDDLLLDPQSSEPFFSQQAAESGYVDTGPLFASDDVFYLWASRYAPSVHVWVPRERLP